jgi:hypothetical protein
MKKLLLLLGLAAVFFLSGCDQNPVFQHSEVSAGVVQQDSVQLPDGSLVVVTAEMRSLVDPAKIIPAGTPLLQDKVTINPVVQGAVKAVALLPIPYADLISYGLNGALGIAAVWLTKRKKTAEKVSESMVKGVDTFRDILDQTEGGAKLDAHLVAALRNQQEAAEVLGTVKLLLDRYATPEKPHHSTLTSAALAKKA